MFNLGQLAGRDMYIEHRHSDGSWSRLSPFRGHHDAAEHDPEREWDTGTVYRCEACEEEVRLVPAGADEFDEEE
jgi:hypothetical protein